MGIAASYYNEFDPFAAQWLRNAIDAGLIPPGEVDTRSIVDVQPDDLRGFSQCHFFAGIGGWALAARMAGWPDERELWTGSAPCQPFSVAGKQLGEQDERHLWPEYYRLIRARWPAVVMGEQVAAAVGKNWIDRVLDDLAGIGYTGRAIVVPACAVDAPHRRDRLWFVADGFDIVGDGECAGLEGLSGDVDYSRGGTIPARSVAAPGSYRQDDPHLGDTELLRRDARVAGNTRGEEAARRERGVVVDRPRTPWTTSSFVECVDGNVRRIGTGVRMLAHGVPARAGRLRAYGNAIVPQVAAEVIGAYMDCAP